MSENNVCANIENETEGKSALYSSRFVMTRELYYDLCSVNYNGTKKRFLFYLCLMTGITILSILSYNYLISYYLYLFSYFLAAFNVTSSLTMFFNTKRGIRIGYERAMIAATKERSHESELFEDKIVVRIDDSKKELYYHQITKFFETNKFLMLHLQHGLYITIEKKNLNKSPFEVKQFLKNKGTLVKRNKFIDCSHDKTWTLVFLIGIIVVSLIAVLLYWI